MILIGDSSNKDLSEKLAKALGTEVQYPDIHVFADTEKRVRLLTEVVDETVLIFKAFPAPVDSELLELCFLADAAKRGGAKEVIAITPYLAYQRADHIFRGGEAVPLEVVIKMIEGSGINRIVMVDPHSIKTPELFIIPIEDISAVPLFAEKIKEIERDLSKVSVVSPDMGGIRRIRLLSEALNNAGWVSVNKDRDLETGSTVATEHDGEIKEICFIVDDMIATGGTVVEAVDYLIEHGAKKVYIMATHPVFAGKAVDLLKNSNAEKVFVTNAIGIPDEKMFPKLEIMDLSTSIAERIKEIIKD